MRQGNSKLLLNCLLESSARVTHSYEAFPYKCASGLKNEAWEGFDFKIEKAEARANELL